MELSPLRSDDSRFGPPPFGRIVKSPPNLTAPMDADAIRDLDNALAAHGLLVIEGQLGLEPAMEWSLISSFPWLDPEYSAAQKTADVAWWQFADCPGVRRLGDAVDEAGNLLGLLNRLGYEWHTDGGGATLLYCERAPASPPRNANDGPGRGRQLMHHISMRARRPQRGWTDVGVLRAPAISST